MKRLAVLIAVSALVSLAPPAGAQSEQAAKGKAGCTTINLGGGRVFYKHNMRCQKAKHYARRVFKTNGRDEPRNFSCESGSNFNEGGSCEHDFKNKYFGWFPGDKRKAAEESRVAAGASVSKERLPKMTPGAAERHARSALRGKFDWFENANTSVHCNRRKSRVRISCKVSWWIGDSSAKGRVTTWYRWRRGEVWWWTSGRIEVLDEYCLYALDKPRSQCTDRKKW